MFGPGDQGEFPVTTGAVGNIGDHADHRPLLRDRDSRCSSMITAIRTSTPGTPALRPKVRIDQIEVIESTLDVRQLRLVLAWAELHREELLENWRLARAGETLREIEPLR